MCVCVSSSAKCLPSAVFPCISSVLPVSHTEGGVPRGYPAFASSVTSQLLVIHHRVVPVLIGHTQAHTQTHTNHRVVSKAIGSADTPKGYKHTQWSRMKLMRSRFSSFRNECVLYICVWVLTVGKHCGFVILQCGCCIVTMCVCVGKNLFSILPHCTVMSFQ